MQKAQNKIIFLDKTGTKILTIRQVKIPSKISKFLMSDCTRIKLIPLLCNIS